MCAVNALLFKEGETVWDTFSSSNQHAPLSFFFAAYAVIANGQVECPKGYKRMNLSHCQGKLKLPLFVRVC